MVEEESFYVSARSQLEEISLGRLKIQGIKPFTDRNILDIVMMSEHEDKRGGQAWVIPCTLDNTEFVMVKLYIDHGDNEARYNTEKYALFYNQECKYILPLKGYAEDDFLGFMLITSHCSHGTLWEHIMTERTAPLARAEVTKYLLQVAKAMVFLHRKDEEHERVLHRDLKSSNVLLHRTSDGEVLARVADFGYSKTVGFSRDSWSVSDIPTNIYAKAPEMLRGDPYNSKCDIYAFGALMWEVLTAIRPFDRTPDRAIADMVLRKRDGKFKAFCYAVCRKVEVSVVGGRLPLQLEVEGHNLIPPSFGPLIESCWAEKITDRVKSFNVIQLKLERILELELVP